ncbi:MAG: hypothetical protein JST15_12090 [Bacteroidetes bacterium]|nr:hypothetical protein [Bacteroidota bacterium]
MNINNSKLIILLNLFSEKEIKEFRKFISSGFISGGRNYVIVLNLLLKYGKTDQDSLTPALLYSKLYPGKKFSIQTLNNRFSELFKLAEEYLIIKTLRENKTEKYRLLLLAYHGTKSEKLFRSCLNRFKNNINSMRESDSKYLYLTFSDRLDISFSRDSIISEETYRKYFENSRNFTALLLKSLFDFGFEFIQQEQANRDFGFNIVSEILERLEMDDSLIRKLYKSDFTIFKIVAMEYYFYDMFKNPVNEKNFFEAKKIFEELKISLDVEYIREVYKKFTNYCILRQNQGVKTFNKELFRIYNEILKLNLFLDHKNVFPQTTFRNYVMIGIMLKKKTWTEKFIRKYSGMLPENIRSDEVSLSYSKLSFSNKNYEKSLHYLSGFRGINYLHYSDSSVIKLCTYYETNKFEEAFFEIDKFRHYIRNHNEIPKIHKEYALNFLKIYKLLINIKTGVDGKDLFQIENIMKKLKLKSRESWLLEKIRELRKE